MSYNPLLDDLLEAQEREAENDAIATRLKKEVSDKLNTMETEYQDKARHERKFRSQRLDQVNKISIMQSSLSRDRVEKIENKLRADFKGPACYNPNPMFVRK